MARPLKEIPQNEFEKLCGLQCTKEEICDFFNVSEKTLNSWCKRTYKKGFSLVFAEKRGLGHISLRRNQFELSRKSAAMAIWLGKQYLNQREPDLRPDNTEAQESDGFLDALDERAEDVWHD